MNRRESRLEWDENGGFKVTTLLLFSGATEGLRGGVAFSGVSACLRPAVPRLSGRKRVMGWTCQKQTSRGSSLTGLRRRQEAGPLGTLCLPVLSVGSFLFLYCDAGVGDGVVVAEVAGEVFVVAGYGYHGGVVGGESTFGNEGFQPSTCAVVGNGLSYA